MKKIIISVLLLAAGFTLVFLVGMVSSETAGPEMDEHSLFTARIDTLKITVTENGTLKAMNSANIVPQFKREGVIMSLVEEGKQVAEGDVLIEFDKTELENQIDDLENRLIQYETEEEAAIASLAIQRKDNSSLIKKAQLAYDHAKQTFEKYVEGDAPNADRKALLEVERAESEHRRSKDKYAQVPTLLAEGYLTKEQEEEERIRLREAEIKLENARTELSLLKKYTRPMELAQKQSDVEEKERDFKRAEESAKINIKEKEARVTQKQRQVKSTNNRLKKLKDESEFMTIKAPEAGIVMYGDPKQPWNNNNIKVGGRVWNGMTLLTIPDLSEMQCLVEIHEADINLVANGQHANITIDSHKGEHFTGTVSKVAKVAATSNFWNSRGSNKQFQVEVDMDTTEIELRAGITAKIEIEIEELKDVLIVPIHTVQNEEGEHFCFVAEGTEILRKTLELGKNNGHYVIIEKGIEPGAKVLLFDPREEGVAEKGGKTSESSNGKSASKDETDTGLSTPGIP